MKDFEFITRTDWPEDVKENHVLNNYFSGWHRLSLDQYNQLDENGKIEISRILAKYHQVKATIFFRPEIAAK